MDDPKILIVLPVYKEEQNLDNTIQSVLKQSFTDFKLIIVDISESLKVAEMVNNYAKKNSKIEYFKEFRSFSLAFWINYLKIFSDTKYFSLIGSNLIYMPDYLEKCMEILIENPEVVNVYSYINIFAKNNENPEIHQENLILNSSDKLERYLGVIKHVNWPLPYYGVCRQQEVFEISSQLEDICGIDEKLIYLAQLSLKGKFQQIEEPLLIKVVGNNNVEDLNDNNEKIINFYQNKLKFAYGITLPHIASIKDHCDKLKQSQDLLPAEKNKLIFETIGILINRWQQEIHKELTRAIDLIIRGHFKRNWEEEIDDALILAADSQSPAGKYRYLDFANLINLLLIFEFSFALLPNFKALNQARAIIFIHLGRYEEAKVAISKELARDANYEPAQKLNNWLLKGDGSFILDF